MTREEAKELLTYIMISYVPKDQYGDYDDPEPYEQAIDMAIEALSEPNGDIISRAEAIEAVRKIVPYVIDKDTGQWGVLVNKANVITELSALPSAEAEGTWLTEYTEEEAEKEFPNIAKYNTSTDLISRTDAVNTIMSEPMNEPRYPIWFADKIKVLPSAEPKTDDENELKFYYVESLDDYWVGRRLDNFYYATWHGCLGFIWSHSKYLPWGEHIVDENTLWKEHTYPSEPIEIPFTEWIVGFVKKYFKGPKTGEWILTPMLSSNYRYKCSICNSHHRARYDYCPSCGTKMLGEDGGE